MTDQYRAMLRGNAEKPLFEERLSFFFSLLAS